MIKNYFKLVFRNMVRHKVYTSLNVFGLIIGISVTFLIALFVKFEWQYDKFYPNADSIYRVIQRQPGNVFMGTDYFGVTEEPLGRTLKSEYPEVENYVTLSSWKDMVVKFDDKSLYQESILYATVPNLFDIFSFEFVNGNANSVLSNPYTIVLSEKAVEKYFRDKNPMGQSITIKDKGDFTITGIFKTMPENSQFAGYDFIISFETYGKSLGSNKSDKFEWGNSSWYTYLLLNKAANPKSFEKNFPSFVKKYIGISEWEKKEREFYLQSLKDIHLYNTTNFNFVPNGNINIILTLSAIALIILIIACINYINMATAKASRRAKEIGIRKVIGANKLILVIQFFSESILLSMLSGIISIVLVEFSLPQFYSIIGTNLGSDVVFQPSSLLGFGIVTLLVGISAGIYPAVVLAKFQPVRVLKGDISKSGKPYLRDALVVVQFAASIALITSTLIILSQLDYIKTKDMGYSRDNIVVLSLKDKSTRDKVSLMRNDFNQYSTIKSISAGSHKPINISSEISIEIPGNSDEKVYTYQLSTDYDFVKTFNIEIVEGRSFSRQISTDSSNGIIINQVLARAFGNTDVVGKTIKANGKTFNIIGIMKDFNMHSLHHEIEPLMVYLSDPWQSFLFLSVQSQNLTGTISYIKSVWEKYITDRPFDYSFLDNDFNALYKTEERLSKIITLASALAIVIACLGLLGLVSFIVEQKKKEIGVRKVLGASILSVTNTISKQFIQLVLLSTLIAFPISYYLMSKWLSDFAYNVQIKYSFFIISGLVTLIAALLTIGFHTIRAASANPVVSLRNE